MSLEQLNSPFRSGQHDDCKGKGGDESKTADGRSATGTGGKRKYRRHPKVLTWSLRGDVACCFDFSLIWLTIWATLQADENAPERPPSAYVIFSNSESRRSGTKINH